MGINNFTLPVADEVKLFIAQRSARDEGAPSPRTFAGHRKRDHIKNISLHNKWRLYFSPYCVTSSVCSEMIDCAAVSEGRRRSVAEDIRWAPQAGPYKKYQPPQ